MSKQCIDNLALFGRDPLFKTVRPISNLVAPNPDRFLYYLKKSYNHSYFQEDMLVKDLEDRLKIIHDTCECVTFCNGLWGMVFCLSILAREDRKEVVMPSFTYRRLGDIVAWLDLVPHYCEINPDTLTVTAKTVESCINESTALILVTQSMTQVVDYDSLIALANKHNLPLVIDSVEAGYGTYKGGMIGSFGNAECFSMHASKLLNAFEAGYVTTNNRDLAKKMRYLRSSRDMELNEIHAAAAIVAVDDLSAQIKRNKIRYYTYRDIVDTIPSMTLLEYNEHEQRGFKNIAVRLDSNWPISRSHLLDLLHAENMLARPYYSPSLHMVKTAYQTIGDSLPITEYMSRNHLLLPCGDLVSLEDIKIVGRFLEFLQVHGKEIEIRINANN